jgi:hypothetical protein
VPLCPIRIIEGPTTNPALVYQIIPTPSWNAFHVTIITQTSPQYLVVSTSWQNVATKARACKGVGQEGNSGVTFHAPGSVRECEGMNPHIPKCAPILGVGVSMDFQIYKEKLQGSKFIGLKSSLYYWKAIRT